MSSYHITFTTPLFSKGAYDDQPEVRPSSIRGQLHWWFRALGGNFDDEKSIFGGVHSGASASKIVVRVNHVAGQKEELKTLPHKGGGMAAPKMAFAPGTQFDLHVLTRLGGLDARLKKSFDRTLEVWLLLGTLGLRATRASGSFTWLLQSEGFDCPLTFDEYESRSEALLKGAPLRFALLDTVYDKTEAARRVVSDTLGGRDDNSGQDDLKRLNDPLGRVFGGRKTSPLRFRIVTCDNEHRIAAIWDSRTQVTGNRPGDLDGIIQLLQQRKPELGNQLLKMSGR